MISFQLDTSNFARAIGFVVVASGKDASVVLNKAGLTALIGGKGVQGALHRTPKADAARIERSLLNDKMAIKIVMARARIKGEKLTRREIGKRVKRLISSRKSAVAYTRGPGWNNAIKGMGGRGVRTSKRFERSEARHGTGEPSTPETLVAKIVNTAPAAEKIGTQALQDALNDTARDMEEFWSKKLQQRFDQVKP